MDTNKLIADVISFFNHPFFIVIGGMSTILMLLSFIYVMYLAIKGLFPVWIRLGIGLSKRKIAIFATDESKNLTDIIMDSRLFSKKNIVNVNMDNMSKAKKEKATIFLVSWGDFASKMDKIIEMKDYSTALIVYASPGCDDIDIQTLNKINNEPNSILVRFRGRLLSDILTSIITTSYEQ